MTDQARLRHEAVPTTRAGFRKDIEGLRAVAVLLVIAYHAHFIRCTAGFLGVDMFFVVSGYLITGLLVEEVARHKTIALADFYARRIRRLLPASVVMLLVVMIAASFILSPFEQTILSRSATAMVAYVSNVYFARGSSDYFAPIAAENPLLHTWSLGVEEQFYFIWPILILLIFKWGRSRKTLSVVMITIIVLSFLAEVHLTRTNQPLAFFLMPCRAWEFAVGSLMSQVPRVGRWRHPRLLDMLGWAGLVTVVAASFTMSSSNYPGTKGVIPVLGTAAILLAGSGEKRVTVSNLLGAGVLQAIGQRSYVLYLWHWPVLVLAAVLAGPLSFRLRLLCVLISFVLAEVTHRTVENPVRFSTYLRAHATQCITASLLVMFLLGGVAWAWRSWAMHTANYATYGSARLDVPDESNADFDLSHYRTRECAALFGESIPRECEFGNLASSKTVVLFGDSHMAQWLPAFQEIAKRNDWRIILFEKSACPALAISVASRLAQGDDHSCSTWRALTIDRIRQLHPTAVVLSNAIEYRDIDSPHSFQSSAEWQLGARKTFDSLQSTHVPVILLRDTPWPHYDVTMCLARASWNGLVECPPVLRSDALNDDIYRAQISGSQGVSRVSFVDLSDLICGRVYCEPKEGKTVIYRDSNHLTATFLRSLSTDLYKALVRVIPTLGN